MWHYLVDHANDYGFLGPIVGSVGVLLGAAAALLFGWTRAFDTWKPPEDSFPAGLERVVGMLCAVGLFIVWSLAEPTNGAAYLRAAIGLAGGALATFLIYVGLRAYVGRFRKPQVDKENKPTRQLVVWGGLWLWADVRKNVRSDNSVEQILEGNLYDRSRVWPASSLTASAIVSALVLIALLVCGTLALATAGAGVQVALTGKPARAIFNRSQVPGLPPTTSPTSSDTSPPALTKNP